jgi:hypothetical protein
MHARTTMRQPQAPHRRLGGDREATFASRRT